MGGVLVVASGVLAPDGDGGDGWLLFLLPKMLGYVRRSWGGSGQEVDVPSPWSNELGLSKQQVTPRLAENLLCHTQTRGETNHRSEEDDDECKDTTRQSGLNVDDALVTATHLLVIIAGGR